MRSPVLSSIHADESEAWNAAVEVFDRRPYGHLGYVLRFAWRARRYPAVVLLGSVGRRDRWQDLLIALLVRRITRPSARIVLTDCTWGVGSESLTGGRRPLGRLVVGLRRLFVRAVEGPRTAFCVLTEAERARFPGTWGVAPDHVFVTPFSHTLYGLEDAPRVRGDYVFAGGDSMRAYPLLAEAVRDLDVEVVVATRRSGVAWPRNVRAEAVSHERFVELLLGAGVVVVPLQDDGHRSAGQQTYLNAMLAEKPVVVTDAMGVREVVTDGVDGIVVPPTAQALRAALERCLSDAARTETAELGRRARETVLRSYTPEDYWRRLVRVVHTPSNGC